MVSIISSNSKNSFGSTINKMYKGRSSGAANTISPANPIASAKQRMNWIVSGDDLSLGSLQQRSATGASIINSGSAGRDFGIKMKPLVRNKTAKDYV